MFFAEKKDKMFVLTATFSVFGSLSYLLHKFSDINATQYSIFYIILFMGINYILKKRLLLKNTCVGTKWDWLLGISLSVATVTGIYFDNGLSIEAMGKNIIGYIICVVCMMPLFRCIFTEVFLLIRRFAEKEKKNEHTRPENTWKIFAVSFSVILGCWILVWLAYYPGLWNYDPWQVEQFINNDYSEFHPLIHTLLLGASYSLGLRLGNANYGVIIYDFVQMMIMAGIFAFTYCYIYKHISSKIWRAITLLFYAVFPANSILAISTTKDVIFSGLVLLCSVLVLEIMEINEPCRKKVILCAIFLFACPIMLLFRNNAVYAFGLMGVFCLVLAITRKEGWKVMAFICACLLLFVSERSFMRNILDPEPGSKNELFSVPSQQFGRIYNSIGETGNLEALELIQCYYDMEELEYEPSIADNMKGGLKLDNENSALNYVKTSLKLFGLYPAVSVDAFLYLTEGWWNINDVSFSTLYEVEWDGAVEHRYGYLLTTIKPGFGITHESKIPWLEELMEKLISKNEYQNLPIISLLFSPALYIWVLVVSTVVIIKRAKPEYLLIFGFLWFLFATVLAGPCVLVRYAYPFIVCSPILICMMINCLKSCDAC